MVVLGPGVGGIAVGNIESFLCRERHAQQRGCALKSSAQIDGMESQMHSSLITVAFKSAASGT